jgi:acetyltransferase-like isoleucine patch superfamily enzyme
VLEKEIVMNVECKKRVKIILQKMHLLSFYQSIVRQRNINKEFLQALKFYSFNNLITFFPNNKVRRSYLKNVLGIKIGKLCFIHMGVRISGNISYGYVNIGDNSVIGRNCVLQGDITIKNNVSITAETYIFASSHIIDSPTFDTFCEPVIIEDYVWIGARAMILPGVRIGKGAILGAASTATKDIPSYTIYAGTPAKEIGKRSELLEYTLCYSPFFQ